MSKRQKSTTWVGGAKRPKAEGHQIKFLECDTDLNKDILLFKMTSAKNECVRFVERPFILTYKVKRVNPTFNALEEEDAANPMYYYLTAKAPGAELVPPPAIREPAVRLPPLLGVEAFFHGCDVVIDQQPVNFARLDRYDVLYATQNNTFCTDEAYKEKYGVDRVRIPNETHNRTRTGAWLKAAETLDFGARGEGNSFRRIEQFTISGTFPFDMHSNPVTTLRKKPSVKGWFAPQTEFAFRLRRRLPIDEAVERTPEGQTDFHYFQDNIPAAIEWTDLILEIEDICIQYESAHIKALPKGVDGLGRFHVDVPVPFFAALPERQAKVQVDFQIPAGTKLLMISYPINAQIYFDRAGKKAISGRTIFPPHLKELRMKIDDEENVLFKDGWTNLGKHNNAQDLACRAYYFSLVNNKLYEGPIDNLFTMGEVDPYKYESVILINLMGHHASKNRVKLELHHLFGSSEGEAAVRLSPKDTNVLLFCMTSMLYYVNQDRTFRFSPIL
jgi:hypothetical protein